MSEHTIIGWTHHTFNPWIGCVKVSDGCKHCYAERLVIKTMRRPGLWGPASTHRRERTSGANWQRVRRWNRAAEQAGVANRIFCASLADVFEDHPDTNAVRPDLWALIRDTPYLQWQLLTKRPEHIRAMLPADWGRDGYANVWLGTSIEDMRVAERADHLRGIPAVVRFISYEPALGPLDDLDVRGIDWVIVGGESGPKHRPMPLDWPRAMRDRCDALGIAFFFKQSAARHTEMGITLDGEIRRDYPRPRCLDWHDWDTLAPEVYAAHAFRYEEEGVRVPIEIDPADAKLAEVLRRDAPRPKDWHETLADEYEDIDR